MWIRTASERDLKEIRALLVETWHDTYDDIYGVEKVNAITDAWHSISALKAKLTMPLSEFVVADSGKRILGIAFASSNDGRIVELHQLYVQPAQQGQGAGKALLTEIEACFPEVRLVRLEVEAANHKSVAFYRSNGFEEAGKTDNCGAAGSGIAALIMEKPVQ
jgi:ribosomal protein S18 acetylase RimI-like enzyme